MSEGIKDPPPYIIPSKPGHTTHTHTHHHHLYLHHHHQTGPLTRMSLSLFPLVQLRVRAPMTWWSTTPTPPSPHKRAQMNPPLTPRKVNTHLTLPWRRTPHRHRELTFWLPFTPLSLSPSVYTNGGGLETSDGKRRFVSYDGGLGSNPGMTTCTSCQQQVMTNVTYKAGTYAWLMCLLFICCGWVGITTATQQHINTTQ